MKTQTAKQFVLIRYPKAKCFINRNSEYEICDTSDNNYVIATSPIFESAWQNAKAKIEEMERKK